MGQPSLAALHTVEFLGFNLALYVLLVGGMAFLGNFAWL
jgi:hypothetical protein